MSPTHVPEGQSKRAPRFQRWEALAALAIVISLVAVDDSHAETPDATLKSLSTSCGKVSPGFSSGRTRYYAYVPNSAATATVTAVLSDPQASLKIGGAPVGDGGTSPPIELTPGRNLIPVEVTARDGATKNAYSLKIVRAYPTPNWIKVKEESPWPARDSAGELVFKDRLWLFGGYTPKVVNDVWSSGDGIYWEKVGNIPNESGVNIPVNFVYDDKMWVVCNDGQLFSSGDGQNWNLVTDAAPWKGRYAAGGVVFAGKMWVMGGLKEGALHSDIWSSTDGIEWELVMESAPWSKRQIFGMATVLNEKIWLLGGGVTVYHPFLAYNDVWSSPDGLNWTEITERAPWPVRIWSSSVAYKNRLWVLSGFRAEPTWENLDDVWYSANGVDWTELKTEGVWSPRHEISAYVFDEKLWVVAGNAWPLMNDVWYLEIPGLVFLSQPVVEAFLNAQYTYRAHADFNESAEEVRYRLIDGPEWLSVDPAAGVIRGTPTTLGEFEVTVEARDGSGETARQIYTLYVIPVR